MTRVLVYSRTTGYRHDSIPAGVRALEQADGLQVVASEEPSALHSLDAYDVVLFLSATGDVLDDAGRAELRRFVEAGGGFVGVHGASAAETSWDFYAELVGARFLSHPQGCQDAEVRVADASHPSTAGLPDPWRFNDEWYAVSSLRDDLQLLLTVDESTYEPGEFTMPGRHPQAWCRPVGAGRSWYTALGHHAEVWSDPTFLGHVLGGIAWAAGR
ncbi:hypothetical protein CLV35_0695 [Motilibacter peucedani]|uniref:ThuA-like domain-containing protein n=1 Tax=Motilibacter peucedani TaxID=598650 RepID=A0A420XUE1_9ACTN|nr:ThuA domain-containing protein [Motilibacter peucedani]RKS80269.1 hypothetical protein CLV35_0695 [Motilibacter peucedani]